jgi:tetratricopeptide (TPR) repeat protein
VALAFHAAHAFLLLLCLWVAFDPPLSPRQISRRLGLSLPFLPLYYLGALCIGYYSGFLLLIFSGDCAPHRRVQRALRWTAPKFVYTLLGLTLLGLLAKNVPAIKATNGPHLDRYARLAASVLPPEGAVLLSEDPTRLALLQAALAREGKSGRYMPVEANSLAFEPYRAWLRRNYPNSWPERKVEAPPPGADHLVSPTNTPLNSTGSLRMITLLVQSNRVFYLHPGSGPFMEHSYLRPLGLLYELKPYPTNALDGPPLTAAELTENKAFWKRTIETGVDPIARSITQAELPRSGVAGWLMEWMHLKTTLPRSVNGLAQWYSGALNGWGVTLQRNDQSSEATRCFALARELNPENLPAQVNLECNRKLLAGQKLTLLAPKSNEEQLGKYRNWNQILTGNGPFDEPAFCYQLSQAYAQRKLWRQAAQQLERVMALVPTDINARLSWGNLMNRCRMPDRALQVAAEIQADPSLQPLDPKVKVELAFLEAEAWFVKTNQAKAEAALLSLLDSHPGDTALLDRTKAVFTVHGSYTNALRIADQQLRPSPDNVPRLMAKGTLCLLAGQFSNAIPPLTRALSLTNSYSGRMHRAFAYVQLGRLNAAEGDYQQALQASPTSCQPYYGLAEVARRKGETNAAIKYYRQYLSTAETNSAEAKRVTARLTELQPGAP